jgi:hypothetical protein
MIKKVVEFAILVQALLGQGQSGDLPPAQAYWAPGTVAIGFNDKLNPGEKEKTLTFLNDGCDSFKVYFLEFSEKVNVDLIGPDGQQPGWVEIHPMIDGKKFTGMAGDHPINTKPHPPATGDWEIKISRGTNQNSSIQYSISILFENPRFRAMIFCPRGIVAKGENVSIHLVATDSWNNNSYVHNLKINSKYYHVSPLLHFKGGPYDLKFTENPLGSGDYVGEILAKDKGYFGITAEVEGSYSNDKTFHRSCSGGFNVDENK